MHTINVFRRGSHDILQSTSDRHDNVNLHDEEKLQYKLMTSLQSIHKLVSMLTRQPHSVSMRDSCREWLASGPVSLAWQ